MTVTLITALHAAETLATYHRERVEQTLGSARDYHLDIAKRRLDDIGRIRRQLSNQLASGARDHRGRACCVGSRKGAQ
jgi:hypothetical protein